MARRLLLILVLLFLFLCLGFLLFVGGAQLFKAPKEGFEQVQAVVVFTGDNERIYELQHVLEHGFKGPVLVSGVHPSVTLKDLITLKIARAMPRITLDYESLTTAENVQKTLQWVQENEVQHVAVITSRYHLPRSKVLFLKSGEPVDIKWFPAERDGVSLDMWMREYVKYLGCLFFYWANNDGKFTFLGLNHAS